MSRILLIGTDGGKRRQYFEKAAAREGMAVAFLDWKDILGLEREEELPPLVEEVLRPECGDGPGRCVAKIDTPEWDSSRLRDLEGLTDRYGEWLRRLSRLPLAGFLNHPLEIAEVLDKRKCKEKLARMGVPVTHMYEEGFSRGEELLAFMEGRGIGQVFVKPLRGAGAAGVAALRYSPGKGRIAVYTCAAMERGELFNTKKMYRLEGKRGIDFLDSLLKLDCVVERWYGKAAFRGYCYDLRVIVQGGGIDYILPRLSKGPITNLHLNNRSAEFADLHLGQDTVHRISEVCLKAAGCYAGLRSIGMDVLLEQGSLKPRIIEMNAQGDLLHRDVYGENRIYGRQIELIRSALGPGAGTGGAV